MIIVLILCDRSISSYYTGGHDWELQAAGCDLRGPLVTHLGDDLSG